MQFEYEGEPTEKTREACECAVTEVIADFWQGYEFDVQHVAAPLGKELRPLKSLVFMRGEL
jgi:GTP:adenosylcobinamide-phosphate guanylyltransferase